MDDVDRRLLVLLAADPRIHLRDLARKLGISRQAVYHRMRTLTELGVLKKPLAGISIPYLDAVPVAVFGRSRSSSIERTLDRLGRSEYSRRAVVAGGNYIYVVGFLRKVSELGAYAEFVRKAAEIPEPTVGIYNPDCALMQGYSVDGGGTARRPSYRNLSKLDLRIINVLKFDARQPISSIAKKVGVTPKTARGHLERMISEGSLDMTNPQDLASGGDIFALVHVGLREDADKEKAAKRLLAKFHFSDQYIRTFSNIPAFLIWVLWAGGIADIRLMLAEVAEDEDVVSVMPNFAYLERMYPNWRDRLPEVQGISKALGGRRIS